MPFSPLPPLRRNYERRGLGASLLTAPWIAPGPNISAVWWAGHPGFVRKHPVATKRAVRAILKATDLCAQEPERVAQLLVDKDYVQRYDAALQVLKDLPYNVWREYDPEDTIRFYALRLHEAGMIKSSPQKIIAQGTNWRFLNELKKELKG